MDSLLRNIDVAKNPETRRPRLWVELLIFGAVFVYYVGGNYLFEVEADPAAPAPKDASRAHSNAWAVWTFQEDLGLLVEPGIQDFFEGIPGAITFLVFFYAGPHFALSLGFLVWVYRARPASFAYVRNAALIFTLTAFTFEWIFPVAPPRLVTDMNMVDSVAETLPVNNRTPWINFLVHDYANVPSVHTGWALIAAVLAIRLTTTPWRWVWLAYPTMIGVSILATGNHYWIDIVAALAWLGATEYVHHSLQLGGRLPSLLPRPQPQPVPAE